jgi:hypothetical protein
MAKLKKATTEMLGIKDNSLSDSFYKSTENLKLMEEAAGGSEEALKKLREAAAHDVLIKLIADETSMDQSVILGKAEALQAALDS